MWRAIHIILWLLILALAGVSFWFAYLIESIVRYEVGDGFYAGMAYSFYDDLIRDWRRIVIWWTFLGTALLVVAYFARPFARSRKVAAQTTERNTRITELDEG